MHFIRGRVPLAESEALQARINPRSCADQRWELPIAAKDLKRKSTRGAAATGGGQAAMFVIRFGSTAVLARMLTPADYGLVAMTAAVTGFFGMFRDAGLTWATIQRQQITHAQISTLFWINAALGCALGAVVAALSPAIARFYDEPRLTAIACALSLGFVSAGLMVQHVALLRRQLRLSALAALHVVSGALGAMAAIGSAAAGLGHWALVIMTLTSSLVELIGVWLLMPWRPGRPTRGTGVRPLLRFGGDILGFNIVNYFSRNADNILIGWRYGSTSLGFYEKAYALLLFPVGQINAPLASVAVPALSRLRDDPARFNRFFAGGMQLVASATMPLILGIAIFADELVRLWLGAAWMDAAQLFQLLAPAAIAGSLQNPMGWILIATGSTRRYRGIGLLIACVVVASFAIGLPFGPSGVAVSYSIASCVMLFVTWPYIVKGTPVSANVVFRSCMPAFFACLPAATGALALLHWGGGGRVGIARTLAAAAVFVVAYAFVLLVVFRRWEFFRGVFGDFLPRGRSSHNAN